MTMRKERVAIIGSGNWGSAIAKIVGNNVLKFPELFEPKVEMWVYEEVVDGERISDIINTKHENTKYLPQIRLPDNIHANPDLISSATNASVLIFVVPHQFVRGVCAQLKAGKQANGGSTLREDVKAISLIKGLDVSTGFTLISTVINQILACDVSVLMGANIANEVAREQFCETTIGYKDKNNGETMRKLFHTKYFRVAAVQDVAGVELCGALKNICAIGAGLVDGLAMGDNTKAAIMRIGLMEMKKFAQTFHDNVKDDTFFESCGIGDIITTCAGGRNRKVAEARVKTGKSFEVLEKEMLNGQKLQGTLTAHEVHAVLKSKGLTPEFPFFTAVYKIIYENAPPESIVDL